MRITREALLKLARSTVEQRTRYNRRLICAYLTGSLLTEEPLLGGATDIDLVFVHDSEPAQPREIQAVTDEIHLDIAHLPRSLFAQPRRLRTDPWVGSYLVNTPLVLHESQHWFEYTQAVVAAQFNSPENRLLRARPLEEDARQAWWRLHTGSQQHGPAALHAYLKALEQAANAIACLSGPPLPERRFQLLFPQRAEAIQHPGLAQGLVDLYVGQAPVEPDCWQGWLDAWEADFIAAAQAGESVPARLHPARLRYYRGAVEALAGDDYSAAALWILLRTWTLSACRLPQPSQGWQALVQALRLGPEHFTERLGALDAYLDHVEEMLDAWAQEYGI